MALAAGVPGHGWKAATIDATGWRALGGLLLAPLAAPLMHVSRWRRRLWPFFQHSFRVAEAPIPALMTEWHKFVLNWSADSVVFVVDGEEVLHSRFGQAGPLGFVGWLDNQWMIVRPTGRLGHGTLTLSMPQWMEIAELSVVNG